jgi:hypothetical protein
VWFARRIEGLRRIGASCVAAGVAAFAIADTVSNVIQIATGAPPPVPSVDDVLDIAGSRLVVAGAMMLFTRAGLRLPAPAILGTSIVVVAAAGLQWVAAGPTVAGSRIPVGIPSSRDDGTLRPTGGFPGPSRGPGNAGGQPTLAMPSIPVGRPEMAATWVRVPSGATANPSTVPAPPDST